MLERLYNPPMPDVEEVVTLSEYAARR